MQLTDWLPTTRKEMDLRGWDVADIILFSGDAYVDHPSFGAAVIGRGVIEPFKIEIVGKGHARSVFKNAADMFVRIKERFKDVIKPRNETFGVVKTIKEGIEPFRTDDLRVFPRIQLNGEKLQTYGFGVSHDKIFVFPFRCEKPGYLPEPLFENFEFLFRKRKFITQFPAHEVAV